MRHIIQPVNGEVKGRLPRGQMLLVPLAIWLAFTVVSGLMLLHGGERQLGQGQARGIHATSPAGYFSLMTNWDGNWYRAVAIDGYPTQLPMDEHGRVEENAWAFYPLYPLLVRSLMTVTTLPFEVCAWGVSLVAGGAAMVAYFRFLHRKVGLFGASASVACVMAYITAPILQMAYTEGLAILLLVLFLSAVERRRLVQALAFALLLSLTRPVALPLGLVLVAALVADLRSARRSTEPSRTLPSVVATLAVFLSAGLWPLIAWVGTGRRDAFIATQSAWPVNEGGLAGGWLRDLLALTPLGLTAAALVLGLTLLATRKSSSALGLEMRAWMLCYPLYLFAASRPSPSILRYLMLALAPLWPFVNSGSGYLSRWRWPKYVLLAALVMGGLAAQYLWVMNVLLVPTPTTPHRFFP